MHTTLYKLERGQKKVLLCLGLLFLLLSIIWFFCELLNINIPMEPIVVFVGGSATLLASYWPFKATNRNACLTGKEPFDYSTNNGYFTIGSGENRFVLAFSSADHEHIYMYNGLHKSKANTDKIAKADGAGCFKDIKDVTEFDYTNTSVQLKIGEIVALRSKETGRYALIQILDVKYQGRKGAMKDEVVFRYVIHTDNSTSFA
ncbi:hypothetical protein [Pectobacterium brasiliense]|uniref:hypothetical protein n=1 Tax=Pectobacterium brasiliense TaxID=180957 RepID=UPI00094A343B|nr:hypothetical protein [Pectobacterium brasiliense]APS30821.1 hypothetical protein NC16_14285 [Pectobacterium brasiliense]